jgi:hypothetical protein
MLALRCVLPALPMVAALSASHLAALVLPLGLRRLYVAGDNDGAGMYAAMAIVGRAAKGASEPITLSSRTGDFNDDLRQIGPAELAAWVRVQLAPKDIAYLPATWRG